MVKNVENRIFYDIRSVTAINLHLSMPVACLCINRFRRNFQHIYTTVVNLQNMLFKYSLQTQTEQS